jgi:hypothetical protein
MIGAECRPQPTSPPGIEVHEVSDGLVVYLPDPPRVHVLNRTATVVYALASGQRSVIEIAQAVREAYTLTEIPVDDVTTCINQLCAAGVLYG